MFSWFKTICRNLFLSELREADEVFVKTLSQIQTCRGNLQVLYDEAELAIRALDVLGERVETARERINERVNKSQVKPQAFSFEDRQRKA